MKKIRLWKLGYIDQNNSMYSLLPTAPMIDKLRCILQEANKIEGGIVDLVWGPDISVEMIQIDDDIETYIVNAEGKLVKV